jgi:hypothetical protein
MRVAVRRGALGVAQQLANDWQAKPTHESIFGGRVPDHRLNEPTGKSLGPMP